MPKLGDHDVFEQQYMSKLRTILLRHGVSLNYDHDRAAIDLGVHFWVDVEGEKQVTGARVWFQAKGFHNTTLSLLDWNNADSIKSPALKLDHVRYWYNAPEPVYLVLYIEAADSFLAADVRELVDRQGGLAKITHQQTATLSILKSETLQSAIAKMPQHRSMRVDGPAWRGRPLGHGLDPLRTALAQMPSQLFIDLVSGLLAAHDFRTQNPSDTLEDLLSTDRPTLLEGSMNYTYEWILPMTTEFGFDEGSEFRIEGTPLHAQGNVIIVIDPLGDASPSSLGIDITARAKAHSTDRVLVMSNARFKPAAFGQWFGGLRSEGIRCEPQDLDSLAFNVLTTTNVYLKFHNRLAFSVIHYL